MLYIVRAFEDDNMYEYEYGDLYHAEDQYNWKSQLNFGFTKTEKKL